jgi:hypothetical protein
MNKFVDLSNQKFGMWLVLNRSDSRNGNIYYLCRCDCGLEKEVLAKNLKSGNSTSCGCIPKTSPQFRDLTGQVFNKWTVIRLESNRDGVLYYWCRCECGEERAVRGTHLSTEASKSCGCLSKWSDDPKLATAYKVYKNSYADGDISFKEFLELSQGNCYYCNLPPSNIMNRYKWKDRGTNKFAVDNGDFIYNGLDRIDSSQPHTKNNVVSCCATCNYAKNDMSIEEFKQWLNRIFSHFGKL